MANKHMRRYSASLIIREMLINIIMRYHLTPFRMAIIKKSTNKVCTAGGKISWYSHSGKQYGNSFKKLTIEDGRGIGGETTFSPTNSSKDHLNAE